MRSPSYRLVNVTQGRMVAARVERAANLWARAIGLIGRHTLGKDEGLWLAPCNGIHTFGLRFPIDILVLDRQQRVVHLRPALPPNRLCLPAKGGHSTVELPAGACRASGVQTGDQLAFESL